MLTLIPVAYADDLTTPEGNLNRVQVGTTAQTGCVDNVEEVISTTTTASRNIIKEDTGDSALYSCDALDIEFDISGLTPLATITNATLQIDFNTVTNALNCDVRHQNNTRAYYLANSDGNEFYNDIINGTAYVSNDSFCTTTGTNRQVILDSSSYADIENAITSGIFNVGLFYNDVVRDGSLHLMNVDNAFLILEYTPAPFDPPGIPTLGALALSDTEIKLTSIPGTSGSNSTLWYGVQCELNNTGGWLNTVANSSYVSTYEIDGLTLGDVLICQWRDGSVDGWSGWSNNATDDLQLQVISTQRTTTTNPDDKLIEFIEFGDSQGGIWFGLGFVPFIIMLFGFMAGKKTVRIFTLITLFLMGMVHAAGYYVYPDWYWTLALLFGIVLVMGRMKRD